MVVADDDFLVLPDRAALNAADADTADELIVVDGRNEHLQRALAVTLGGIDVVDDRLKKRGEVGSLFVGAVGRDTAPRRAEERGRLELFLRRVEIEKKF